MCGQWAQPNVYLSVSFLWEKDTDLVFIIPCICICFYWKNIVMRNLKMLDVIDDLQRMEKCSLHT